MMRIKNKSGEVIFEVDANTFVGVDLRGFDFRGADLRKTDFRGADLRDANLDEVDIEKSSLSGINLAGASLRKANLFGANITGADLSDADLRGADFRAASLRKANLFGANITGADLSDVNLRGAYFSGADLHLTHLPSPGVMLLAKWGHLSDELTLEAMRMNAANMPLPEQFDMWVKNGSCPYIGTDTQPLVNFHWKPDLWSPGTPSMTLYELMAAILEEKCRWSRRTKLAGEEEK